MERRKFLFTAGLALTLAGVAGCGELLPSDPSGQDSTVVDPGLNRLDPHPRDAVAAECLLAVMGWDWHVDQQVGGDAAGDWNYIATDLNAYNVVKGWYPGTASFDPLFDDPQAYGLQAGYGRGGQCPYFANLILYRSGVYQQRLPSYSASKSDYYGPRTYTKPAHQARMGDVIRTFTNNGHTAIVVLIMAGGYNGPVTAVDVIDSNFVGNHRPYNLREVIGRHIISTDSQGYSDLDAYYAIDLIRLGGR